MPVVGRRPIKRVASREEKSLVFKKKVHTATIEFAVRVDLIARIYMSVFDGRDG